VLQDVVQKYSSTWSEETWEEAYARALAYVLELPHARTVDPAGSQDLVRAPSLASQQELSLGMPLVLSMTEVNAEPLIVDVFCALEVFILCIQAED
jgi:hypothetical protein